VKPLIGLTAYEETAAWNQWEDRAALLPARYVRAVEKAGGLPVLIPVQELTAEDAKRLVGRLDGVILTGGPDVDPVLYGAVVHPKTSQPRHDRDVIETAVCEAASGSRPLLAICRGLQVLNVARGGTLHQHLPDLLGNDSHSPQAHGYGTHDVRLSSGTLLSKMIGSDSAPVPTHHHQAIERLGAGLTVTATADDGTIEAVEDPSVTFLVGVQWHPEAGEDPALFEGLVAAAREHAEGQSPSG
jgi:putative glutamine amidotransferase